MSNELIPVFDGHNDVLLHLHRNDISGNSFFERTTGHLDLERCRRGGFAGGFFAIFIPTPTEDARINELVVDSDGGITFPMADPIDIDYARRCALEMMSILARLERMSNGDFHVVRNIDELVGAVRHDAIAAILHFEGAEPIDRQLNTLEAYYAAGLRSLGIVWSRKNAFAEGVPFAFPRSPDTGPGLSDAGRALVFACNELGIMIDLSHINEKGFRDVAALSRAPLVATHSNAHVLCPSTRNLTDWQLDAVRDSGGIVGLNFAVVFLREDGRDDADVPIETMVRHVSYMVERMGIEHVALGSDFDGAAIPRELGDVTGLPKLLTALRQAGFDDQALAMIAHENWIRVLSSTWK